MSGGTYIQWGRKLCSALEVQILYTGVAAGSHYQNQGGEKILNVFHSIRHGDIIEMVTYGAEY